MDYGQPQSGLGSHKLDANKEHGTRLNCVATSQPMMYAKRIDMNDAFGINVN